MRKTSNVFRWLAVGFLAWFLTNLFSLVTSLAFCLVPVIGWAYAILMIVSLILVFPIVLLSAFAYTIAIIALIQLAKGKQSVGFSIFLLISAVIIIGNIPLIIASIFALISAILKKSADKKEAAAEEYTDEYVEEYTEETYYTEA